MQPILKYILVVLLWSVTFISNAQQSILDSSTNHLRMKEVIINNHAKNVADDAFNFYRSSKIASTEDILQRIEGVNLVRRGPFGMEPTLRSYSSGQINVMLNGMRIYGACTDKMDPVTSYVEPGNLSSLEINHGAEGSHFGSTIGGSVNMQLKEATFQCHNQIQSNVYTQFNTANNGINTGMWVNIRTPKFAFRISATHRKAKDFLSGGTKIINHSAYEKQNINFSIAYKIDSLQFLIFDYIMDKGRNIGYPALPMDVSKADAHIMSVTHRKFFKKSTVNHLETRIYFNKVTHQMDDTNRPETVIHMDMPGWSETSGFYSQLNYQKKRFINSARIDAHRSFTKAEMTMYPKKEKEMFMLTLPGNHLSNAGCSLYSKYHVSQKLSMGINYRFDYFEQSISDTFGIKQWSGFGINATKPLINLNHNVSAFTEFRKGNYLSRLSISKGERIPTANERFGFYLFNRADGYDYLANYNLHNESSRQIEWKNTYGRKKVSATVTLFYHYINDYIYGYVLNNYSAMTIGARGVKTYKNIEYAISKGAEASYGYLFTDRLKYKGNVRYVHASVSNGMPMQQVPPLKFINNFAYKFNHVQFQFEHVFANQQLRINADFGEVTTPLWNVFNIRSAYLKQMGKTKIQLHFAIENILDIYYREHLDWGNIPQFGRNITIGINLYFN